MFRLPVFTGFIAFSQVPSGIAFNNVSTQSTKAIGQFFAIPLTQPFLTSPIDLEKLFSGICRGFVTQTLPQGRGICNTNSRVDSDFRDKLIRISRGLVTRSCPQESGICRLTFANPHLCPTWGRCGFTLIGALPFYKAPYANNLFPVLIRQKIPYWLAARAYQNSYFSNQ